MREPHPDVLAYGGQGYHGSQDQTDFLLQYKLLHITFCKASIALHFVGSCFTPQAFQRRRMEQAQFLALECKWRPGKCTMVLGK